MQVFPHVFVGAALLLHFNLDTGSGPFRAWFGQCGSGMVRARGGSGVVRAWFGHGSGKRGWFGHGSGMVRAWFGQGGSGMVRAKVVRAWFGHGSGKGRVWIQFSNGEWCWYAG